MQRFVRILAPALCAWAAFPIHAEQNAAERAYLETLERTNREQAVQLTETAERKAAFWGALKVDASDDACLAYQPEKARCLATVGRFNAELEGAATALADAGPEYRPWPGFTDSTRKATLRILLEPAWLESKVAATGRDAAVDSAIIPVLDREGKEAMAGGGAARMRALSESHRGAFRGDTLASVYGIASTDSGYLAGLGDNTAYAHFNLELRAARGLALGGRDSVPLRVPFGYFLPKRVTWRIRREIGFQDALPVLSQFESLTDAAEDPTAAAAARPLEKRVGRGQDTLRLWAWLVPTPTRGRRFRESGGGEDAAPELDTVRVKPLPINQFDLPDDVRRRLLSALALGAGTEAGPWRMRSGTWRIRMEAAQAGSSASASLSDSATAPQDRMTEAKRIWQDKVESLRNGAVSDLAGKEIPGEFEAWVKRSVTNPFF